MGLNFISISKTEGILSPLELKSLYFYGIPIQEKNGTEMSDQTIYTYIQSAQKQVEGYLSLKLEKQVIEESITFYREDFANYSYIQTSYPVVKPHRMQGYLAETKQVEYPSTWLISKKTNDGHSYHRRIHLIPVGGMVGEVLTFNGLQPYIGMYGRSFIPDYWRVAYCTGWDRIPEDILTVVGKFASILIFHQLGDIILGAGIANMSLGVDGLSQSIGTTSSATNAGYGARIINYVNDLKRELPMLRDKFSGMIMTAL
jgi:hypothetical protein